MTRLFFTLHGLKVELACPDPELRRPLAGFLDYLGLESASPCPSDIVIELRPGTFPARPDEPWVVLPAAGFEVLADHGRIEARDRQTHFSIDPGSGTARGRTTVAAGCDLNLNLVSHALLTLLRYHDLYPLHAAGLARGDRGLLIIGDSGSGKTTLATLLLEAGWSILGDDSLLVRPTGSGVEAVALRRDLYVMPDNPLATCGALRPSPRDPAKIRIDVEALFPAARCDRCLPTEILFPGIADRATSLLEACDPDEALHLLAHHGLVTEMETGRAARHMAVLAALVRQCCCRRLEAGRDLPGNSERAENLLSS